ncbi:efflux RND transporter periplasmic adaptor subunit [bacterium]|nr:efflux RND transporter periplasmic adaptor subunit [bacterium]
MTLVIGLILGWLFFGGLSSHESEEMLHSDEHHEAIWTCSMHPQVRKSEPGQCPICGMDLIPLSQEVQDVDVNEIRMSPTALKLANVQTMLVGSEDSKKVLRLNGKVEIDERRVFTQSSHIQGRVEKLNVDFTGEFIMKGNIVAYIYSPELIAAQKELLEAKRMNQQDRRLFEAAKTKLRNLKISQKQIDEIITSEEIIEEFPIRSEIAGVAHKKMVNVGDYIAKGEALYQIADLSKVWVLFDVYESDISFVKKGQVIEYTVQGLPNKKFKNEIDFIDPVFNGGTRVTKARVEHENQGNNLMPGMFAKGELLSPLENTKSSLTIPKSAVLWTGKRSIVYVRSQENSQPIFKKREVILGQTLDDAYVIESGLTAGEEIVVNGAFSVDAAAQLAGKPSMMNENGNSESTTMGHDHGSHVSNQSSNESSVSYKPAADRWIKIYLELSDALSSDDIMNARSHASSLLKTVEADLRSLEFGNNSLHKTNAHDLRSSLTEFLKTKSEEGMRTNFVKISKLIISIAHSISTRNQTLFVLECPMANNDKGATWLSDSKKVKNPYFGSSMLKCGAVIDTLD